MRNSRKNEKKRVAGTAAFSCIGILTLCGMMYQSEEKPDEYAYPNVICEESSENGWYTTAPEIRIVHSDTDAVTQYKIINPSGRETEGEIRSEWSDKEENPGDTDSEDAEDPEDIADSEETPVKGSGDGSESDKKGEHQYDRGEEEGKITEGEKAEEETPDEECDDEDQEMIPEEGTGEGKEQAEPEELILPRTIWEEGENRLIVKMFSEEGKEVYHTEKTICLDETDPERVAFSYPFRKKQGILYVRSAFSVGVSSSDDVSGVSEIVCVLEDGTERRVKGSEGTVDIPLGYNGRLAAYSVDMAGRKGEISRSDIIQCENESPSVSLHAEDGFDTWHRESVRVTVEVEEPGTQYGFSTGLSSVTCYAAGDPVARRIYSDSQGPVICENLQFMVENESGNGEGITVMIHVSDRAGNVAVKTEKIYIDRKPPSLQITGAHEMMITSDAVQLGLEAADDNILEKVQADIWMTDMQGRKSCPEAAAPEDWEMSEQGRRTVLYLEKDGIYECTLSAEDSAGNRSERKIIFTIDRTSPVIRYADQMDGQYIPFFKWNYGSEEMIEDFTEYSYQMYLNGKPYFSGTRVDREGVWLLEIRAEDAAGNISAAEAVFVIDHTAPVIHWGDTENGGSYEDSTMLSIWVDGKGEWLDQISINGEKQKLSSDSRIFQYEITDAGNYAVEVKVSDLAGNEKTEKICFDVRERDGIIEKIVQPVKHAFAERKQQDNAESGGTVLILAFTGGLLVICALLGRFIWVKNRKSP